MKKVLLFASILLSFVLASCSKDNGASSGTQTVLINVAQDKWQYSNLDNNNYFVATVDMPEITERVFERGLIKVYRTYDFNSSDARQIELPNVAHKEVFFNGQWVFYTETVDYEIGVGKIFIYFTANDFDYELNEEFVPDAMQFRAVIMY